MTYDMDRQARSFMENLVDVVKKVKTLDKLGMAANATDDPEVEDLLFAAMLVEADNLKPLVEKLFASRQEVAVIEFREEMEEQEKENED